MIDYQSELNPEQYKVVTSADGPSLILAGAGSGKTRTIVYRVAYLVEKGIDPRNILLLTFTNKAAREMVGRVEELLQGATLKYQGHTLKFPYGGTFHHFANMVLRRYASVLGYEENYTILDEEDSCDLIKNTLNSVIKNKETKLPSPAILRDLWSYCRNSQYNFEEVLGGHYPKFYSLKGLLWQVLELYEKKKRTANVMDFDDLLLNLLSLLKNNKEIHKTLSQQFRYILVDEYQDTNYIQAQILYYLGSYYQNILVVGDDAQSIYSFRGAEIRNILNFPQVFPKTKIFKLETNYRSTPEILKVANKIISNNFEQHPKNLQPVCASYLKPFLVPAVSLDGEASFIAEEILRLIDEGIKPSEIAVLFRAAYQSQRLEMELNRRNIPYDYRGGLRFFERAHIKDIIAFLKVINNFKDEPSWLRILNLQEGIGDETASKIFSEISKLSKFEEIFSFTVPSKSSLQPPPFEKREGGFLQKGKVGWGLSARAAVGWKSLISILESAKDKEPGQAIHSLIKSDYGEYLFAKYLNAEDRIDDLKVMAEFAARYKNLNDFLSEVSLQEYYSGDEAKENPEESEKIILSTIHQAKGLEWNSVFIMGLNEKHFPHYRALYEPNGLEEERRLFYVAATRAKRNLYFTYSLTQGFGGEYLVQPSRFVREIPEKLLEKLTLDGEDLMTVEL